MKFFCKTYHEERDTENCVFCSAACPQRPYTESTTGTGEFPKDKEKKAGVSDVTIIDICEENISKKDLLKKFEEALDNFTDNTNIDSITARVIVRPICHSVHQKVASVLSDLVRNADSACL